MKAMKLMQVATMMAVMLWAAEVWASSPGGEIAGTVFGQEVAVARKCGFSAGKVERFEANQVKAITISRASNIYIKDALKAFFHAVEDVSVSATEQKCKEIENQMNLLEKRYKE